MSALGGVKNWLWQRDGPLKAGVGQAKGPRRPRSPGAMGVKPGRPAVRRGSSGMLERQGESSGTRERGGQCQMPWGQARQGPKVQQVGGGLGREVRGQAEGTAGVRDRGWLVAAAGTPVAGEGATLQDESWRAVGVGEWGVVSRQMRPAWRLHFKTIVNLRVLVAKSVLSPQRKLSTS